MRLNRQRLLFGEAREFSADYTAVRLGPTKKNGREARFANVHKIAHGPGMVDAKSR
jgi:hypothetical protein